MTSPIKDNIRVFVNNEIRFIRKREIYHNFNINFTRWLYELPQSRLNQILINHRWIKVRAYMKNLCCSL